MRIVQSIVAGIVPALFLAANVCAQNVGIGVTNPQSKLTVNGNLAVGDSTYNVAAPTNGAIIQGMVGINDNAPTEAPLVVRSNTVPVQGGTGTGFGSASTSLGSFDASSGYNCSIYATNTIIANTLVAESTVRALSSVTFSDSRLKNIVGESDSASDLQTLKKIRITDYTMKDTSVLGSGTFKKVIAQQVENVYPRAVSKVTDYLPDILTIGKLARRENGLFEISTDKVLGLSPGDKVKVVTEAGESEFVTVKAASPKAFVAKLKLIRNDDRVFVYGRQVHDLRCVDYDAISMLNVSATQELAKKVETLEHENSDLQNQTKRLAAVEGQERATIAEQNGKIADQDKKVAALEAVATEVEELKKAVATMQEKEKFGVQTAALEQ